MDSSKPPKPDLLLNDLEAIRQLLEKEQLEPLLLTEPMDNDLQIPLLSEIIEPGPDAPSVAHPTTAPTQPMARVALSYPAQPAVTTASGGMPLSQAVQEKLDAELRAAAQLILQDVIDDFVPQIEAELKRRLEARLDRLLLPRQ